MEREYVINSRALDSQERRQQNPPPSSNVECVCGGAKKCCAAAFAESIQQVIDVICARSENARELIFRDTQR